MGVDLTCNASNFYIKVENFKPKSLDVEDGYITAGTHRVLRFDFDVHNRGDAALTIGSPSDPENADLFTFDNRTGHKHYHFKDFNEYDLFKSDGTKVGDGFKQGFCIIDSVHVDPYGPATAQFTDCNVNQGISSGWADRYQASLPGQYILVDNLKSGDYVLQCTTDHGQKFVEDNELNNTVQIGLHISGNSVSVTRAAYVPDHVW